MSNIQSISAVIIDDSLHSRNLLSLMLEEYAPHIDVVGFAQNGIEGLKLIQKHKPHIAFLDIEMPGKSGIQLAEELVENKCTCAVIFITAYNQYAIRAFQLSALDYLLKPIQEDLLKSTIDKINLRIDEKSAIKKLNVFIENMQSEKSVKITLPTLSGVDVIDICDIVSITAEGAYSVLKMTNGDSKVFSKNLKYFENTLQGLKQFTRVHRSHIIHIEKVTSYQLTSGTGKVKMVNGDSLDIARDRKSVFNEKMKEYSEKV
jgi:two-component system, LytTR family, response regulator